MPDLLTVGTALAVTLLIGWPVVLLLRRGGVVDVPNARSSHSKVTPRGGGIAIVVGVASGLVMSSAPLMAWGVFGGAVVAAAVGFVDDVRGLPALLRLGAQGVIAVVLASWLVSPGGLETIALVLAVLGAALWTTAYINAFNFMDGINGISGASAAAAGAWFVLVGGAESIPALKTSGLVLLGSGLGFLPWNAGRAAMFLGDVGSYFLGTFIAAAVVVGVVAGVPPFVAAAPLLLYLVDTGWTLLRRVRRGDPWREAHRDHAYQRLCDAGWSHGLVTLLVLAVTAAVCFVVAAWPGWLAALSCLLLLGGYVLLPRGRVRSARTGA